MSLARSGSSSPGRRCSRPPWLGDPVAIELPADSRAVGKTLAELNLRGATDATVLAVRRGEQAIVMPSARERLCAGDRLAIAGSHEALAAARELLVATPVAG